MFRKKEKEVLKAFIFPILRRSHQILLSPKAIAGDLLPSLSSYIVH